MTIRITVDRDYCILAIAYALYLEPDKKISKREFVGDVSWYLEEFGHSCEDDHNSEYNQFWEQATDITDKYFK